LQLKLVLLESVPSGDRAAARAPLRKPPELREDNLTLVSLMKETHNLCDEHGDIATASLIENWVDEAERRAWFLFESTREAPSKHIGPSTAMPDDTWPARKFGDIS
jgi:hypothetical protein